MSMHLRVLAVEDSEDDVLLLSHELKRGGYKPVLKRVETASAMRTALKEEKWHIVISDFIMPQFTGLSALEILKKSRLDIPFIIVSGKIGEDIAVEAMKAGAHDYIVKGNLSRLVPAVARELREKETRQQRRIAEEALKESEDKFRALATTATDAIVMMDDGGRISYWNPAAERMFRFKEGEALGKELHRFLSPQKYHEHFRKEISNFIRTGQGPAVGATVEFLACQKSGLEFPVEVSLSAVKVKKGWHAVGIIRDITDRKRAEEEIRKHRDHLEELVEERTTELKGTNEKLQQEIADRKIAEEALWKAIAKVEEERAKSEAIIAGMGDGLVIQDTQFRIIYQNHIHKDLMGDHIGEYCYSAYYNRNEFCEGCAILTSFKTGKICKVERSVTTGRGIMDIEIISSPLKDAGGNIIAGIEVVRDITDRKRMEVELREHRDHLDVMVKERTFELRKVNRQLRAEIMRRIQMEKDLIESQRFVHRITDATPNILYLYDVVENSIVYINPVVEQILGYTPEEIKRLGSSYYPTILHPGDTDFFPAVKQRFAEVGDGDVVESEYRMKNRRGEWRWFYSRDVIFKRTGDGVLKLVLGVAQDITTRKVAEEELKNSREQLRGLLAHLQSVREDERARISREIHDELGQALTALKIDLSWIIKRLNKDQKPLYEKTQLMSQLIDMNIQTVKRICAELRPGLLDVLGLTAALEWQAEEFQNRTGIKCDITIDPDDIALERDLSTAIFRIFQETLTNVVRHARAKKVVASLKKKDGKLTLKVKDNGRGITEKQITSPKSIGLIGMRERVHYLGGQVEIGGIKDKGTTVIVDFPLSEGLNGCSSI
jgi:PAS domain S-box-containing protein